MWLMCTHVKSVPSCWHRLRHPPGKSRCCCNCCCCRSGHWIGCQCRWRTTGHWTPQHCWSGLRKQNSRANKRKCCDQASPRSQGRLQHHKYFPVPNAATTGHERCQPGKTIACIPDLRHVDAQQHCWRVPAMIAVAQDIFHPKFVCNCNIQSQLWRPPARPARSSAPPV